MGTGRAESNIPEDRLDAALAYYGLPRRDRAEDQREQPPTGILAGTLPEPEHSADRVLTRLLPDAHLSGRTIGPALRVLGHDIRALDAEKYLQGLTNEDVLEPAISEDRLLITATVADFLLLLTTLIESGRSHPGCILVLNSSRNEDFGPLISAIDRELRDVPADEWTDRIRLARRS